MITKANSGYLIPSTNMGKRNTKPLQVVDQPLKLDLGCGINKKEGFLGVDERPFKGVDLVHDLRKTWPWKDSSVTEVNSSHFVEHLEPMERVHFVNELYRVLIPDGKAFLVVPNWSSARAYGDLTHKWPPVSEFWFYYLDKNWRAANAPHNDFYTCDFNATGGWSMHPAIQTRNVEYQQHALQFWKEAGQDILMTLQARK